MSVIVEKVRTRPANRDQASLRQTMSALLNMPEVRQRLSPLSVEEYHQLGEFNPFGRRTELIRGIVIEKLPKSPPHSTIGSILYKLLLKQVPDGFTLRKEEPLTLADSEPEPDIALVRGQDSDFTNAHPITAELVVEIAVSSTALDRANVSLYAEAGVKEYWIVLGRERKVEVHRSPEKGQYHERRTFGADERLDCKSVPGVSFRVSDIFQV